MQLAPTVDQELISEYFGGEITLANDTSNNGASLVRGTLLGARIQGHWVSLKYTCDEYARGSLDAPEEAVWVPSTGGATESLLYAEFDLNDGALNFSQKTPQGTTARISLPVTTTNEQAA